MYTFFETPVFQIDQSMGSTVGQHLVESGIVRTKKTRKFTRIMSIVAAYSSHLADLFSNIINRAARLFEGLEPFGSLFQRK